MAAMSDPATGYRVLARKYRPQTFAEVIGQEAMVRTLSNAIAEGRIAQAFILTGVRGVGKTTTARIIARALNCIGADGTGAPTISPCGECVHCRSIAEDRHIDVIEMDAASRTGVDDIRDLTEGVRYRPVSARYKVYIIDEVHMLSKNAFNALLKTLEEPPPDVKFVFATTEVHKVPVTVLSRCQRFSLRRVSVEQLIAHYRQIAAAETVEIAPAALGLIARAADGSVRDGLSLLDQAIALSAGRIEEAAVRDMLGIADRGLVFDLFETVLKGDAKSARQQGESLDRGGALSPVGGEGGVEGATSGGSIDALTLPRLRRGPLPLPRCGRGACTGVEPRDSLAGRHSRGADSGRDRGGCAVRCDAAEFCRADRAVRPAARGADPLASVVACPSRRVRAGPHRVPAAGGGAARPRQPPR